MPVKITARDGSVCIEVTLYGPCSPERLAQEERVAKHRANQLNLTPKAKHTPRPLFGDPALGEA